MNIYINDSHINLPFEAFDATIHVAGKAIVIDNNNNIAIIHSKKYGWYELPWWHVDPWENEENAVIRECKEEIGCNISIISKICTVTEERYRERYKKISHYFICTMYWEKGIPTLMESEIDEDLETLRIPKNKLKELFDSNDYKNIERKFVQLRDTYVIDTFLQI